MTIGSHLPLEKKIQGSSSQDFQYYFDQFPEAVDELASFAAELFPPSLAPQLPALLGSWAQKLGVDEAHPILAGRDSSPGPSAEGQQLFDAVEKAWMDMGTLAPVAIATMVFQKESDVSDSIVPITDDPQTNRIRWEVSSSILTIPPEERNQSCESDTYQSDAHRDEESAPRQARDWEGPFLIKVDLYEPSPHLKSLRHEAWMSRVLPSRAPSPRQPGVRL